MLHHYRLRTFSSPLGKLLSGLGLLCLATSLPAFATKGIFQGRVVEGNQRDAGKYIYIEGRAGYLRRVNVEKCRVRYAASVPSSQRVRSAAESLRETAEVRVTAEQREDGEWVASDILILKLPRLDKVRLLAELKRLALV